MEQSVNNEKREPRLITFQRLNILEAILAEIGWQEDYWGQVDVLKIKPENGANCAAITVLYSIDKSEKKDPE